METIYTYTIKLLRYVLNGDVPELPENIDFEKLFAFGRSHGVENMLYIALRDLNINVPKDIIAAFKKAYEMQIMVEATQALELEAICEGFEEAGIDYMPLKGSVVRFLYPMPDYRKSGDIDILIHPEHEEKTDVVMAELGYEREHEHDNHEIHFAYHKKPFIEVEIHRSLTHTHERASEFCKSVWNYAEQDKVFFHKFNMNTEYMYVYLLAHLCKHLNKGGAGIKLITDFMVIRKNVKLDEVKLKKYLKEARLTDLDIIKLF